MSGIEVFTPLVHEVTIGGQKVSVGPFKARQFSEVQAALAPIWPAIFLSAEGEGSLDFGVVAGERYPEVRRAICAATGLTPDFVDGQDPFDVVNLFALIVDANADFSRRRIVPALNGLAETVARTFAARDGVLSSPASAASASLSTPPST